MVKIKGPLFSESASGTVADCMTFSKRKSGQQVRFQRKQKPVLTSYKQFDNKSLYRLIEARWFSFTPIEKAVYNNDTKVIGSKMSGWNYFLKLAMASPLTYLGLFAFWTMNKANFSTVLDLSKNSNTVTLRPTFPTNCPLYVASKDIKMLNALSFDGIGTFLSTLVNHTSFGNTPFSISVWTKSNTSTAQQGIFGYADGSQNGLILQCRAGGAVWFYRGSGVSNDLVTYTPVPSYKNRWLNIVGTWDGSFLRLYINGVQVGSTVASTRVLNINGYNYSIGKGYNAAEYFSGLIDNVCLYKRVLSLTEISKLYNLYV
jgi:hypothetical protein